MNFQNMLLLFTMACVLGPRAGTARIKSSSDAPWKPGRVAAYWIQETESSEDDGGDDSGGYYYDRSYRVGQGMLFLVDAEKLDCDALLGEQWMDDGSLLGEGLLIQASYYEVAYDGQELSDDLGFEGLYIGESYAADANARREMEIFAVQDGFLSAVTFYGFGLDGSWLRIDAVGGDGVQGEFYTPAWEGRFNAENCGEYEPAYWDTGNYR